MFSIFENASSHKYADGNGIRIFIAVAGLDSVNRLI